MNTEEKRPVQIRKYISYAAFACFAATTPLFSPNSYLFAGLPGAEDIGWFVFAIFGAAIATSVWSITRPRGLNVRPAQKICIALLYVVSTLACALFAMFPQTGEAFASVSGIVCGITTVFVLNAWAYRLSMFTYTHALFAAALLCTASALVSIATYAVPQPVRIFVETALLLIGTCVPMTMHTDEAENEEDSDSKTQDNVESSGQLFYTLRMPALSVFLYAFIMSVNKVFVFGTLDGEYIGGIVASCFVVIVLAIHRENLSSLVNHILMPVIAAVMVVCAVLCLSSSQRFVAEFCIYVCMSAAALFASAQFIAALHAKEFSVRFIVGNAVLLWSIVSCVGLVIIRLLSPANDFTWLLILTIAIYCAIMIVSLGLDSWRMVQHPANDDGETVQSDGADTLPDDFTNRLTNREREVFALLARGHSITYIAEQLFISESTVRTHVKHIYAKLGVHSREELFALVDAHRTTGDVPALQWLL